MNTNTYFVSRQIYWPEGEHIVEVAVGGLDYANPDMLVHKYEGEAVEYADARAAAESAISIRDAWRKDEPNTEIDVAHGCTGGMTMPFEACTAEELTAWAEKRWENTPKCDHCGAVLPEAYFTDAFGEARFCREYCAEEEVSDE
jgi:hypothetical protein